jgi:uncharacterized repeat protein (TIGR03803 family)
MRGKTVGVLAVALILVTGAFTATKALKINHKPVTFTTLYNFTDGSNDGGGPFGQPVVDRDGNIFGTASAGGASDDGTVWEFNSSGAISALHSFDYSDGAYPYGGLALQNAAVNGNMWGTTSAGGSGSWGTVFEINSSGTFSTLYNFGSHGGDPEYILSSAIVHGGNVYGTSNRGGTDGRGTIWEVSSSGTETILHSFHGDDGGAPYFSNLLRDKAGDLFGVTYNGGADDYGVLFELTSGGVFSVLHSFNGSSDGGGPFGNVLEYKGSLYGTADGGGSNNYGTMWQYNISGGTFTVLHNFDYSDGAHPLGGVSCQEGKTTVCAGNLFGTTFYGGANGYGVVFEIDSSGAYTDLHDFDYSDGAGPYARPFVDTAGNVYGTTDYGGSSDEGTLWEITGSKAKVHRH